MKEKTKLWLRRHAPTLITVGIAATGACVCATGIYGYNPFMYAIAKLLPH